MPTPTTNTQAEIPFATWVPAHPSNYHPRSAAMIANGVYDLIIIHITSGHAKAMPVAEMWQKPAPPGHQGTSAHLVIDHDGSIIQAVPLRFAANHAHDANDRSIGIEHCAREPNEPSFPPGDPGLRPSDVQLQQSARLVAWLLKAAGKTPIRGVTIEGHAAADPKTTHTLCPDGAPWPWEKYMSMVMDAFNQINDDDPQPLVA